MNSTRSSSDTFPNFQATLVNAGYGQLVLRDPIGKVSQKWTLSQPKCILGRAENCTIRCTQPGMADHHLLLIVGAKQLFLRSMAHGLVVNGKAVSEIVISSNPHIAAQREIDFELAGNRFQYLRSPLKTPLNKPEFQTADANQLVASNFALQGIESQFVQSNPVDSTHVDHAAPPTGRRSTSFELNDTSASTDNRPRPGERMRFTFVRALEKNRADAQLEPSAANSDVASKPMWVEEIVRDALRPVESQLEEITGPLQNLERQMRQAQRRQRKLMQARKKRNAPPQPIAPPPPSRELLESQEAIQRIVADQAERLAEVNRHVSEIMSQIATIERTIAQESDQHQTIVNTTNRSGEEIMRLQREMMELVTQLQSQVAQPETTRADELQWRASVEKQLEELHTSLAVLNEIKVDLHQAIDQSRELSQEWESHWQTIEEVARRPVVIQQPAPQPYALPSSDAPEPDSYAADNKVVPYVAPTISFDRSPIDVAPAAAVQPTPIQQPAIQQFPVQQFPIQQPAIQQPAIQPPLVAQPPVAASQPSYAVQAHPYAALQYQPDIRDDEGLEELKPVDSLQPVEPQTESVIDQVAVREPVQLPDWWKDDPVADVPSASRSGIVDNQPVQQSSPDQGLQNYFSSKYFPSATHQPVVDGGPTADSVYAPSPLPEPLSAADDYAISAFSEENLSIANGQSAAQSHYEPQADAPYAQDQHAQDQQAYDQQAYGQQAYDQQAYDQQSFMQQASDQQPQPPALDPEQWPSNANAYQQNQYAQYDQEQARYDQAQYDQAQYDQAQYDQAQYNDSPYTRPSFGQPSDSPYASASPLTPMGEQVDEGRIDPTSNDQFANAAYANNGGVNHGDVNNLYGDRPHAADEDEHQEAYSSLGIDDLVRESSADEDQFEEQYPGAIQREMPTAYGQSGAATDYNTQSMGGAQEQATRPNTAYEQPTVSAHAANTAQHHSSAGGEEDGGDESVEDYMRRLLARMRGVSESEVTLPGLDKQANSVREPSAVANQSADRSAAQSVDAEPMPEAWTEPFDPEKYVPRGSAPEKNRDLNALRELANTSARSAIQVSARRRQGSALLIKSTVALVGLIAGVAIISINGAKINIAFIATIASFLVAIIWGYDTLTSIRPLLQSLRSPKSKETTIAE